jgi:hypothetical protein
VKVDLARMRRLVLLGVVFLAACNGIGQSAECEQYLACVDAVNPGASANFASYSQTGSCWSTDQRSADQCTAACVQGRNILRAGVGAGTAECQ